MATEPPTLTPHQTKSVLEAGALLIDLRPREEFASRHIPRSINVVFSRKSLPERIATAIPPGPPIVLLSGKADIAEAAVETLQRVDRNPLRGLLASGTESWDNAGLPLATLPQVTVEILWQRLHVAHDELMLIDVREPFEWKLCCIKTSQGSRTFLAAWVTGSRPATPPSACHNRPSADHPPCIHSARISETSGRVNSSGSASPFRRSSRTRVPLSVTRSDASCGQVLAEAIPSQRRQKNASSKKSGVMSNSSRDSRRKRSRAAYG